MAPQPEQKRTTTHRSPWLYAGSVIILVIVVVTFVGAPAIGGIAGGRQFVFGRYGSEEIVWQPGNFFARQYDVIAQSLRDAGNELNLELQLRLAWREAFNRTVLHTAIRQAAERAGMVISETRVDEIIAQDPQFLVNGRFDVRAYESISNQERFALRTFHREADMFDQVVRDALSGGRFSDAERAFVASMTGPERSFEVVRFSFDSFPEEQVRSFGEANPDLFATVELAMITLASEDEAVQIREQAVQPGNPFGDLARTYSRDSFADQSGQMGSLFGYELQQELIEPDDLGALVALPTDEISEVVETTGGWAFFLALERPTPLDLTTDEGVETVRNYMDIFEAGRIQDFVEAEAAGFATAARANGMSPAAEVAEMDVLETAYFGVNYGNNQLLGSIPSQQIPELADAAFRTDVFETLFSLGPDEVSDPIVIRQSAFVFALNDEREAQEGDVDFVTEFYGSLVGQFQADEVERAFVDQDQLRDNFTEAFERFVLGNG